MDRLLNHIVFLALFNWHCMWTSNLVSHYFVGNGTMEANVVHDDVVIEGEFVLLDLDSVPEQFDIPPNAPYFVCVRTCKLLLFSNCLVLYLWFVIIS